MTTQDDTGDKLIRSIRRTKAGTAAEATPSTAAKKVTTRRPPRPAPPQPAAAEAEAAAAPQDSYQSAGRVWPD